MSGEHGVVLPLGFQEQVSKAKHTCSKTNSKKMEIGAYYWAPTVEAIHCPQRAKGPFNDEIAAAEAAFHEVAADPQMVLPGITVRQRFFTGRASHLIQSLPNFAEEYIDMVRETLIPEEADDQTVEATGIDDWLFRIPSDLVEKLDSGFKSNFKKWLTDNSLDPPLCNIDDLKHHEV